MQHLTPADYTIQPWKNGKGRTIEMWRREENGRLLIRLSRATVTEDGPFSVFPGIARNLTVLSGPGFRLTGAGLDLRCHPLVPVEFPGDLSVMASETEGQQSDDFNVMTAAHLPRPQVRVVQNDALAAGGLLALYALGPVTVNDRPVARDDLILTGNAATLSGEWPMIAVRFSGAAGTAVP